MEMLLAVVLLGLALGIALLSWLILVGWRWRRRRRQVLWEDALKEIYSAKQEGRSLTPVELGGHLGRSVSSVLRLNQELEAAGLLRSHAGLLDLTETGERLGLHVLRGHRLWERYLSDEARLPLNRLHAAAESAEHNLTDDELNILADHLGHPRTDPHGDIIPTATGKFLPREQTPLTDWPFGQAAVVVHIEDEPREVLNQILRAGLRPGTVLRVIEHNAAAIICQTAAGRCTLSPVLAAHVDVRIAAEGEELAGPAVTLAELALGQEAEVLGLSQHCTGLGRRRLLDLGFTPGARIEAVLTSAKDSAHAYRIRETLIALRKEQAQDVLIRRPAAQTHVTSGSTAVSPC